MTPDLRMFELVAESEALCIAKVRRGVDVKKYFWPTLSVALTVVLGGLVYWEFRPRPTPPPPIPVVPALELPATLDCTAPDVFVLEANGRAKVDGWLVDGNVKLREVHREGNLIKYFAPVPGKGSVFCYGVVNGRAVLTRCVVTVRGDKPPEPSPDPPTPQPDPPTPPASGIYVLIVEETADRDDLPREQVQILFDKRVRDYFREKCAKEGNDHRAFRIWDQNVDTENEGAFWKEAMKRQRQSTPWLVISDGKKYLFEGPLPKTVDETLTLLKKYGG